MYRARNDISILAYLTCKNPKQLNCLLKIY